MRCPKHEEIELLTEERIIGYTGVDQNPLEGDVEHILGELRKDSAYFSQPQESRPCRTEKDQSTYP